MIKEQDVHFQRNIKLNYVAVSERGTKHKWNVFIDQQSVWRHARQTDDWVKAEKCIQANLMRIGKAANIQ
jgi:hypothetical protein